MIIELIGDPAVLSDYLSLAEIEEMKEILRQSGNVPILHFKIKILRDSIEKMVADNLREDPGWSSEREFCLTGAILGGALLGAVLSTPSAGLTGYFTVAISTAVLTVICLKITPEVTDDISMTGCEQFKLATLLGSDPAFQNREQQIFEELLERTNYYNLEHIKFCIVGKGVGTAIERCPGYPPKQYSINQPTKLEVLGAKVWGTAKSGKLNLNGTRSGSTINLSSQFGGRATLVVNADNSIAGDFSYSVPDNGDGCAESGSGTASGTISCVPPEENI